MLTSDEERYILANAYVPEHLPGLMTHLSGGEPFLIDGHLCIQRDDWMIVVGYPLGREFDEKQLEAALEAMRKRFSSTTSWVIAPKLPSSFLKRCQERESDHYYTLVSTRSKLGGDLKRTLNRAADLLVVERSRRTGKEHEDLSTEFIHRADPHPRIRELLFKSLAYVRHSSSALVLNAWNRQNELSAFYVVDLSAEKFSTYVIGCHSKKHYVPGASDLLLHETINLSAEMHKEYLHLGLGVNDGIRRFKAKWGGKPILPYEMCELVLKKQSFLSAFLRLRFGR